MSVSKIISVCMVHAFDPRGDKVGGVETFVRDYISFLPPDVRLLLVGVDQVGDLKLGEVTQLAFRGKQFDFMPVMRVPQSEDNFYAKKLSDSLTLKFLLAVLRYIRPLRGYIRQNNSSLELRRMEHFPIALAVGAPFIQMLHDGKTKDKAMSSLLKRFWWVNESAERLSLHFSTKFFCVSDELTARLKKNYPRYASKLETLTTWANPNIFSPQPFPTTETTRIVYAGRLDAFKRPEIMFKIVGMIAQISDRQVRFHYIGDGDPELFPEFNAIRDITILEGKRKAEEVADIYSKAHLGILTSDFEGMPRMVMEMLTVGRPVVALDLPQLHSVIHAGVSGRIVMRSNTQIEDMASALLETADEISLGTLNPISVSSSVKDYSPTELLEKLFREHRRLAGVEPRTQEALG